MKICFECDKPAAPNRVRCPECLERANTNMRAFTKRRREKGLCIDCGHPSEGLRYCPACRSHRNQLARERYAKRVAEGRCRHCGRAIELHGLKHCSQCLEMIRRNKAKRAVDHPYHKSKKRDGFLCQMCGKTTSLVTHHINGRGERGKRVPGNPRKRQKPDNSLDNLITLCRGCHGAITRFRHLDRRDLAIHLIMFTSDL